MIAAVKQVPLLRWEFLLSAKLDPDDYTDGECSGLDEMAVVARLQRTFPDCDVVLVKCLGPQRDGDMIDIKDDFEEPVVKEIALPTPPGTAAQSPEESKEDDGLIRLPMDMFVPYELED